ncbi:MAG: PD40 domain-containing protein [Alphaproteobacteria bacterium]|nr:PD40 domain-containing protein [Alphaproteobacteria bacterium]
MQSIFASTAFALSAVVTSGLGQGDDNLSGLKGPYLGQTPPGMTAKPFAPGIVNTEEWGDAVSFSPDMTTVHVSRWRHSRESEVPENATFKKAGDGWHKIVVPAGTRKPSYSPDGNIQHYRAKYKERTADGWSELKSLGPVFEAIDIMGLTASADGTLVFDEWTRDGNGVLRYSRLVDGMREAPKPLPKEINTGLWNAHPFIAPDESYIMWDGEREGGFGSNDLFISFRQPDGSWGDAINLGNKVNTDAEEGGPQVTPDGKYIFFNRMVLPVSGEGEPQSDLYWISAQIIENLRPKQ